MMTFVRGLTKLGTHCTLYGQLHEHPVAGYVPAARLMAEAYDEIAAMSF
ncbi:MAG: hypothetical protein GQF41_1996 [Candidatus Rifleibacterium amylolyticum]|nr:MAG: hypothetical protein GQF41_1996 [Candidatus Rifleibacterium amylolyticum]